MYAKNQFLATLKASLWYNTSSRVRFHHDFTLQEDRQRKCISMSTPKTEPQASMVSITEEVNYIYEALSTYYIDKAKNDAMLNEKKVCYKQLLHNAITKFDFPFIYKSTAGQIVAESLFSLSNTINDKFGTGISQEKISVSTFYEDYEIETSINKSAYESVVKALDNYYNEKYYNKKDNSDLTGSTLYDIRDSLKNHISPDSLVEMCSYYQNYTSYKKEWYNVLSEPNIKTTIVKESNHPLYFLAGETYKQLQKRTRIKMKKILLIVKLTYSDMFKKDISCITGIISEYIKDYNNNYLPIKDYCDYVNKRLPAMIDPNFFYRANNSFKPVLSKEKSVLQIKYSQQNKTFRVIDNGKNSNTHDIFKNDDDLFNLVNKEIVRSLTTFFVYTNNKAEKNKTMYKKMLEMFSIQDYQYIYNTMLFFYNGHILKCSYDKMSDALGNLGEKAYTKMSDWGNSDLDNDFYSQMYIVVKHLFINLLILSKDINFFNEVIEKNGDNLKDKLTLVYNSQTLTKIT